MLAAFLASYALTSLVLRLLRLARHQVRELMERDAAEPVHRAVTLASLLFLFVPIAVVVLFSFHSTGGLSFPFRGFSLRWYEEVFGSPEFRERVRSTASSWPPRPRS